MSVNRYRPHVLVLPEDDANRQLANGFLLEPALSARQIRVLEEAGGWQVVLEKFNSDEAPGMENNPARCMILLIDFDADQGRLEYVKSRIPLTLIDRVFILGSWKDPEDLKRALSNSLEGIGSELAKECAERTNSLWSNKLLDHNSAELNRMRSTVVPILFPDLA